MRMLKMSIMKFSGMSKWKESHRESSELLTEAWTHSSLSPHFTDVETEAQGGAETPRQYLPGKFPQLCPGGHSPGPQHLKQTSLCL